MASAERIRDLGVLLSNRLEYKEHIADVVRRAALVSSWIMGAFTLRSPSAYLRLFEAHVIPIMTYASQVWHPSQLGQVEDLRRVQKRFLRRVEHRCGLQRHELVITDIVDRLGKNDIVHFRKMIKDEKVFNEFFQLTTTSSRRGFVLSAHSRAKTRLVSDQFAWRIASSVNSV